MASFYERRILPKLLTCACASPPMMKQRTKIVPLATGRVLELGVGMGLNLALYDADKVSSVSGVDPAAALRAQAEAAPRDPRLSVKVEDGTAEDLPFEDHSFDCVVCTFTLCSVHTPRQALAEARRVLKPGGRFLCLEFSTVQVAALAPIYDAWSFKVLPRLGQAVAGDAESYQYLAESIRMHPDQETLAAMMREAGFGQVRVQNLSGGIAAIHSGWRL
jgi:ubiquinone/menaquinone biosynthesis methyltransferase